MSADVINQEIARRRIWCVNGINWTAEVKLDKYNLEFDDETQSFEAASWALAAFKGKDKHGVEIVMDAGEDIPLLSTVMICFLKGTDPEKGFTPFTHVILANEGYYKESAKMQQILEKDLEEIKQNQIKEEQEQAKIAEQVKKLKNKPPT